MKNDYINIVLGIDMSDVDVQDAAITAKLARLTNPNANIVCYISGYDDDSRELNDIPECRVLAKRLMETGIIAWLDGAGDGGLGAMELWLLSRGELANGTKVAIRNLDAAIEEAKAIGIARDESASRDN